ncbi:1,6-anhydro-N-acetylmuramyl-L-alanine amidase AmpD [Polynucleobacter sp. TUM22923]|uniref:1,6-anhydro-N-acetylmuramyl-L-alanine amidase AmpD n=1 Tax=Polynucleobacter sp. TUM22923 TaxID=3022126 RepID=UPI0025732328|nr:1,6-anhydro-N-acetylmuramyl-L-alanine amidase AmpD [Polynucleobacter sp. TUM22923]
MTKWILLFAGVIIFYLWFKGKNRAKVSANQDLGDCALQPKRSAPEAMVQCQYCQLHLPKSSALINEERYYCSMGHLNAIDASGWLGSALWRVSPNQDARPEGTNPDLMVIHHISLPPGGFVKGRCTQFVVDFFQNKLDSALDPYFEEIADQTVSSHFLIARSGEIFQLVSTHNRAWHAGLSSFLGREKCNDFSIGVELEGDGNHPFEEIQYLSLATLSGQLQSMYPNLAFAGHSDIAPNRKTDPGISFDWEKFRTKSNISSEKLPFGLHSR